MRYIKPGTIGYWKDSNNVVHQVKCIDYTLGTSTLYPVIWAVAGRDKPLTSMLGGSTGVVNGSIYKTPDDAYNGNGERLTTNAEFDAKKLALQYYPKAVVSYSEVFHDYYAKTYVVDKNMTVRQQNGDTAIHFHITEEGITPSIPRVDKGEIFLTFDDAAASRPKPQIITFDDDEQVAEKKDEMCRIIIDIRKSEVEKLANSCSVVKVIGTTAD